MHTSKLPDGVYDIPATDVFPALPGFTLFMALDQTGSIGTEGAERGVEIIDEFRNQVASNRILGIGFVSFGDVMVYTQEITRDLDGVRAFLLDAVTNPESPFYGDGGEDLPENGVDGLQVALDQMAASELEQQATKRYIFLKTDNNFDHNVADETEVNAALNSSVVTKTWLEFIDTEDGGTQYSVAFPETAKVSHGDFNP